MYYMPELSKGGAGMRELIEEYGQIAVIVVIGMLLIKVFMAVITGLSV